MEKNTLPVEDVVVEEVVVDETLTATPAPEEVENVSSTEELG